MTHLTRQLQIDDVSVEEFEILMGRTLVKDVGVTPTIWNGRRWMTTRREMLSEHI